MAETVFARLTLPMGGWVWPISFPPPDCPLPADSLCAIDTETIKFENGLPVDLAYMIVCWPESRVVHILHARDAGQYLNRILRRDHAPTIAFHNGPFDVRVLAYHSPLLDRTYRQLVDNGKIIDTGVRYLMRQLLEGKASSNEWKLDLVAKKRLGLVMEKKDEIRLTFSPYMELTEEHVLYMAGDAVATALAAIALPQTDASEIYVMRGFYTFSNMSYRGLQADPVYRDRIINQLSGELVEVNDTLYDFGWKQGRKGNTKIVQRIMLWIEEVTGIQIQRTPSGRCPACKKSVKCEFAYADPARDICPTCRGPVTRSVCLKEEAIEELGENIHPFIGWYRESLHLAKMLSTFCTPKYDDAMHRVHSSFHPMMVTGRTSSRAPNLQNPTKKHGVRGIYIAGYGWVMCSSDYCQLELCGLAEHCFLRFGKSVMRDVINSGVDIHKWFGQKIKEFGSSLFEGIDFRQLAKAANFGFPGGLGARRFIVYARGYGVELTLDQAQALRDLWLASFPEMTEHLKPPVSYIVKYDMTDLELEEAGRGQRYMGITVTGRIRANCSFCAACNTPFQGSSADGARNGSWGLPLLPLTLGNFVHDENITLFPRSNRVQWIVEQVEGIMIARMQEVLPNVSIRVESALMLRWDKKAKAIYNKKGDMQIWVPDVIEYTKKDIEANGPLQEDALISRAAELAAMPLYNAEGKPFGWYPIASYAPWDKPW